MFRRDAVYFYIELLRKIILVSAGDCRFIRLRGGRDKGRICPFICAASARQKDDEPKGSRGKSFRM